MIGPQYAQPYTQGTPSASAVNIQIFEPKAYASPQPAVQPNYTNPIYNYPQTSMYGPMPAAQPYMPYQAPYMPYQMPQMMPQAMPYPMPVPQAVPYPMPLPQQMPQYPTAQVPTQPAMPQAPQAPYVEQPQVYTVPPQVITPQQQPMPAPAIEPQPQPAVAQPTVQPVAPVDVQQPAQPAQTIDVGALVAGLQSADPAIQEKTITEIANYSQGEPAQAQQVLNEQIMSGLANIVSQDISQLPGPTPEQMAVLEKAARGEQLTPEETQLAQQLAPQTAAAKNKIISMFTLAMLQKNQRDELEAYMASQGNTNIRPIQMQDLIGFNEIQNAIQTNPNPEVRLAGVQAISFVAKPEDAQTVMMALQPTLTNDPEPLIQQAAQETLAKIGAVPVQAQAA